MNEGIIMYTTFKRIVSKHTTEADIVAWKGFLLGIIIAVSIIGPVVSLALLLFIFEEHTDLDEHIIQYIKTWFQ
jgi:hypothetical protein